MTFIQGNLDGVWIVEPRVFGDNRGFCMETWSKRELEAKGCTTTSYRTTTRTRR